jgi:Mn-dependent DtxR family transcriptional regulator
MGQSDIISLLKGQQNRWFNANDISKTLKVSVGSVLACLRRLRKSRLVNFKSQSTKVGAVYKKIFVYRLRKKAEVD